MARTKLRRFAELKMLSNATEQPKDSAGNWQNQFDQSASITLELGCGGGDYTLELAQQHPEKNFIGMDIQGERLWYGAKRAIELQLGNVRFLRGFIDHITDYFDENEVDEIWITFPDPHPKKGGARKRLTHELFLSRYQKILKPKGVIHLKTDDDQFFEFSKKSITKQGFRILKEIEDIYAQPINDPNLNIQTYFEKKHLAKGKKIHYLQCLKNN